jgi:transcriptional regulator with XRE-family HTH domain
MSPALSETDKRIGARIRAARVALGLSQSSIGEALDLTYQQVQKYERGSNRLSVGTLQRIAEKLGMPASVFLDPEHRDIHDSRAHPGLNVMAVNDVRSSLLRLAESLGTAPPAIAEPAAETTQNVHRLEYRKRARERVRGWQKFR